MFIYLLHSFTCRNNGQDVHGKVMICLLSDSMRELLSNPALKPSKEHILAAVENFQELLRIRFSSPLFRLKTANAIQVLIKEHHVGYK